ncbi:MAG: sugar porter family MFS transporter [Kiritimatiellae bacterium]|nr:sugar porter family MFS transporter [Kiritimatiellia bacterium]
MSDSNSNLPVSVRRYAKYLLVMAGLGGLIYGIDVGVCAAAYPYIEKTSSFTPWQLGFIVGAVLWGSVVSSLFAGALSEWLGRKKVIIISALFFTLSIPVICASGFFEGGNFFLITLGRVLQGASAGLVGVIVPMYLAECLAPADRGKGTGMFQLLLTIGLVFAAVVGLVVVKIVGAADAETVTAASKTTAWQTIFWCSAIPGVVLFFGAMKLRESPRWLYNKGRKEEALASLAANNGEEAAKVILSQMIAADEAEAKEKAALAESAVGDTVFQKKYIYPFILAIVILACNQTTGINSVLNYSVKIFQETGLRGEFANWSDLTIKIVNMVMTLVACALVDRKGRKFLLKLGTSGIILGLSGVGTSFLAIQNGWLVPSMTTGVITTAFFFLFIASFAVGPGVCAWLALSELMPARIRANGMSIGMIINQGVSATIASVFPKWAAATSFATVFYMLAGFTVVYLLTVTFFLPETKGRTLEEIEHYFKTGTMPEQA